MKPTERTDELLRDAGNAYERARWRKGIRAAALVVPMMVLSAFCCGRTSVCALIGGALAILVTVLVWRGGSAGRAVAPGLAAGIVALAIPLLTCRVCGTVGALAFCVLGGLTSGTMVARSAWREPDGRAIFVAAGGTLAALAGCFGCIAVGLGGVLAMAVGLAIVTPFALRGARAGGA